MGCICEFDLECSGDGFLVCRGCGGDFCVCADCYGNGGMECPGCPACEYDDDAEPSSEEPAHG